MSAVCVRCVHGDSAYVTIDCGCTRAQSPDIWTLATPEQFRKCTVLTHPGGSLVWQGEVGECVGISVGKNVGSAVGVSVGLLVGFAEGLMLGISVGEVDGAAEGDFVG